MVDQFTYDSYGSPRIAYTTGTAKTRTKTKLTLDFIILKPFWYYVYVLSMSIFCSYMPT